MFGEDPKVGLALSRLPPEILERQSSGSTSAFATTTDDPAREDIDEQASVSGEQPLAPVSKSTSLHATNQSAETRENFPVHHDESPGPQSSTPLDKRLEDISNQSIVKEQVSHSYPRQN